MVFNDWESSCELCVNKDLERCDHDLIQVLS
jgi:hypothetical protein